MRRIMIVFCLFLLSLPVVAQDDSDWSLYLFDNANQSLIEVDIDGNVTPLPLTFPQETFIGAFDLRFSPDGALVAYCERNYSASAGAGLVPSTLVVRDVTTGDTRFQQDIGLTQLCQVEAFNTDGNRIAVALDFSPPDTPGRQAGAPAWALRVFDANAGDVVAEITAQSSLMDDSTRDGMVTPVVQAFDQELLAFALFPFFDPDMGRGYDWSLSDGTITSNALATELAYVQLPLTGEIAYLTFDDNFDAPSRVSGMIPPINSLMVALPDEAPYMAVFSPEWQMDDLVFVNGGADLAVRELGGLDPNSNLMLTRWRVLGRDGAGISEVISPSSNITQVVDAPDGYAVLTAESDTLEFSMEGTATVVTDLKIWRGSIPYDLWEEISEDISVGWEIVWSAPVAPPAELPPFSGAG